MTWLMLRHLKTFFVRKAVKLMSVGEQVLREHITRAAARYESGAVRSHDHAAGRDEVAFIRCTDVKEQLLEYLREHAAHRRLRQLGAVSGDKLRVTVVGDKGGAYTKLVLVVWDVLECQSPKNTVLLGMYRGDEEYDLMAQVFGPVFQQLAALTQDNAFAVPPSPAIAQAHPTAAAIAALAHDKRLGKFAAPRAAPPHRSTRSD
jgi:Protein of unknown function (DUF1280)